MPRYKVERAVHDKMIEIVSYIYEESGIDVSDRFFTVFRDFLQTISEFPHKGRKIYSEPIEVRKMALPNPFGNFIVYWMVYESIAHITHVRHTSQRKPSIRPLVYPK